LNTGPANGGLLRRSEHQKRLQEKTAGHQRSARFSSSWLLNKIFIFQKLVALVFSTVLMGNTQPDPGSQNWTYGLPSSTVAMANVQPDQSPLQPDPRALLGNWGIAASKLRVNGWQRE